MKTLKEYIVNENNFFKNLGVGQIKLIKEWLDDHEVKNYIINPDMTIDVNGYVSLGKYAEKQLPDYIQFGEVTMGFDYSGCPKLESLRGVPERVGGYFDCGDCPKLESLEGAPQYVGGSFHCNNCAKLKSLKGSPQKVVGVFNCSYCTKLESLDGSPREVGSGFYCHGCGGEFTRGGVEKICKVIGDIRV